ncbi:hypothetical protein BGW80DRAFT_1253148 [Lactifluus volemus]|nr:hypothetical protein BGW80DRAFT_1253148 [Lactifluus volemus]
MATAASLPVPGWHIRSTKRTYSDGLARRLVLVKGPCFPIITASQAKLTISRLEDLSINTTLEAMCFPPSSSRHLTSPTQMARISSSFEDPNCEKERRSGATVADQERTREAEEDRTRLEQDLGRKAAAQVVREERTEEERRVRDREERRQRDAEKSAEVASRMEEWRLEEEHKVDELARAEDELKRRERREVARVAATKSCLEGASFFATGSP